jgi:hypothetical protein
MGNSGSTPTHPTPTHPASTHSKPTHAVLPPDINSNLPKCINCGKKNAYIDHFYNKQFARCLDCLRGKSEEQEPKPSATHFFPPIDNNTSSETYIRASRATTHAALPTAQPSPFKSKKVKKRSKKRSINRGRKV